MIQHRDPTNADEPLGFHAELHPGGASARVALRGELRLAQDDALRARLMELVPTEARDVQLDLDGVEHLDGASVATLLAVRAEVRMRGATCDFTRVPPEAARLLELYGCPLDYTCLKAPPTKIPMLDHIGRGVWQGIQTVIGVLDFVGAFTRSLGAAIRRPRTIPWSDLGGLMERTGADGTPIVLLINFLIGLIIALQSAEQLQRFGASIFVADLVGLSVTRELAPLMTAFILAGRTGAAYAAELGTMRVSEEIDALEAMHLDPLRHLVFPRVLALLLVAPVLVVLADVVGVLGGLLVALRSLGLAPETYFNGIVGAVGIADVVSGLIKGGVFAATIALISCQRGLATSGGAAGVGTSTTSAVVSILFALVVLDALFTALFHAVGL